MKKLLPIIFATFLFFSCRKETNDLSLQIRVQNTSAYAIESIILVAESKDAPFETQFEYGNLGSNQVSNYQSQQVVLNMPTCKFKVNGNWLQFVPRCAVGLQELDVGRYTLKISTDDLGNITYPELIRD